MLSIVSRDLFARPMYRDQDGVQIARGVGAVLGIPTLARTTAGSDSQVMTRVTNLSSLTVQWLLQFKPEVRERMLETVGGWNWTAAMLRTARSIPGGIGISDAIRFSLGLHFLVGLLDDTAGKHSDDAQAYRSFKELFLGANQRVTGSIESLDGLGNWFTKTFIDPLVDGAKKAADKVVEVARDAGDALQEAANVGKSVIKQGLEAILPKPIAGALYWIIDKGLQLITSTAVMLIELVSASVESFLLFLSHLARGQVMDAIKALLMGATKMIFMMFLPISATFLGTTPAELRTLADRVATRSPLFPLALILAVIGLAAMTPASISALILALAPAIAVLLGATLRGKINQSVPRAKQWSLDKAETAIDKTIRWTLVIIGGAMVITDMWPRLKTQLVAFVKGNGTTQSGAQTIAASVLTKMKAQWGRVETAFKQAKLNQASVAVQGLITFVPEVFGAIMEDTSNALPAFSETIQLIKEMPGTQEDQNRRLFEAQRQVLDSLAPETRFQLITQNAESLPPSAAGRAAATIMRQNVIRGGSQAAADFERGFIEVVRAS